MTEEQTPRKKLYPGLLSSALRLGAGAQIAHVDVGGELEPGDFASDGEGNVELVEEVFEITCDGCGKTGRIPAQMCPGGKKPEVAMCPACVRAS